MSNNETTLLTSVFELACPHADESNVNLTGAEYLDKSGAELIEVAGPVFEMLGLGEIDEQSTFGWRPTPRLIRIIAERAAGLTNESESNSAISLSDILTVLLTPAQGEAAPTYADDIAELALRMNAKPASAILHDLAEAGKKAQDTLVQALDSWRHLDQSLGLSLRSKQSALKNDCEHLIEKLTTLSSASRDSSAYVALILICKDLERIALHAVNIAEQAAFTVPSYS